MDDLEYDQSNIEFDDIPEKYPYNHGGIILRNSFDYNVIENNSIADIHDLSKMEIEENIEYEEKRIKQLSIQITHCKFMLTESVRDIVNPSLSDYCKWFKKNREYFQIIKEAKYEKDFMRRKIKTRNDLLKKKESCIFLSAQIKEFDRAWNDQMEQYRDIARQKYGCRSDDGERARYECPRYEKYRIDPEESTGVFKHSGFYD